MVKRVAIIGGGVSGLVATKSCIEEGLDPTCFEQRDSVGGLWAFEDKVQDNLSCCMWSTTMNTSKEMSCFSDFLMPKESPNFLHNVEALEYLRNYARHFNLDKHFSLNTEVVMVKRSPDFSNTGQWIVRRPHDSGNKKHLNDQVFSSNRISFNRSEYKIRRSKDGVFDAVIVCSGHHGEKHIPRFPGLGEFKGQILHSHDYRKPLDFTGKRVLVVGLGNSGGDIASEIGQVGQVVLSTRRGVWVVPRGLGRGLPLDVALHTRLGFLLQKVLPFSWGQMLAAADLSERLDHDLYGLTSSSLPNGFALFISDDLASRIICGKVKVKEDVKSFSTSSVEFVDGTVEDIDAVIFATGYHIRFPFMEKEVVEVKDNIMPLYKRVFLPDLEQQTLAFVGFFNANGCLWPICELQSRLAVRVLSGAMKLPTRKAMKDDIELMEEARPKCSQTHFVTLSRWTSSLTWTNLLRWRLLLTDPKLGLRVLCGPCVPSQFRLQGPGHWPGAREAILTVMDRVRYPLQTRRLPPGLPKTIERLREFFYPSKTWIVSLYLTIIGLLFWIIVN
ncbi:LOW QUALITY PROTEIN: dimethylaniline monooxygenase [N-oxide-forming] 5-like [Pomacea canaliculata]|uniref:LOW QUALITY PROTEIN: dimethylaniline monooxygenase [N-oxide-forming] 5-like n=1 Tax=Pomacea canaliculata TaxID=400727 RepID=UPI000D736738|nr:LOW QUALITY PROTEIN: dimethylaniline monooxygenase [N-oxide-forming] 5-like [Pomacea canaliculata]